MIKRLFDIFFSITALIALSPVIVIVACIIRKKLGSPIIFKQIRPGKDEKLFEMIKFRSMCDAYDENGCILPDSERITPFGIWLRSTSLDELPEFWNVIKGEMSLVGPRPLLIEYLSLYTDEQSRRHQVRPGITGWAQVNGRNAISWEEKFKLDIWYVDHQTLWLDLKILLLTFKKVFIREGVNAVGHTTIKPFRGNSGNRK